MEPLGVALIPPKPSSKEQPVPGPRDLLGIHYVPALQPQVPPVPKHLTPLHGAHGGQQEKQRRHRPCHLVWKKKHGGHRANGNAACCGDRRGR
jgi:hypothetical protein